MNWKDLKISADWTHFLHEGKAQWEGRFKSVLKFHPPGLAPVEGEDGWFFINEEGHEVISGRYIRAWGFYCERSAVEEGSGCYHISPAGVPAYTERYAWCGNFQEDLCTVRSREGHYFHIRPEGTRAYPENFRYAGDFKDGYACVMLPTGNFKHIDREGRYIYPDEFKDLGIFHKGYATARDEGGWFHIDLNGRPVYEMRFAMVEPFYNGMAFGEGQSGEKLVLNQKGEIIISG